MIFIKRISNRLWFVIQKGSRKSGAFALLQSDQLDNSHLSAVASTGTDLGHSGVAAVTVSVLGSNLSKQLGNNVLLGNKSQNKASVVKGVGLCCCYHFLRHSLNFLGAS